MADIWILKMKKDPDICFINPGVEVENPEKRRLYGTIDMFPATLASLGVKIEDNRLGLGSNLSVIYIVKKESDSEESTSSGKRKSYYLEQKQDKSTETAYYETTIDLNQVKLSKNSSDPLTFTIQVKNGEGTTYSLQGPTIDPSQYLNN
jgi:hypothetical protein